MTQAGKDQPKSEVLEKLRRERWEKRLYENWDREEAEQVAAYDLEAEHNQDRDIRTYCRWHGL